MTKKKIKTQDGCWIQLVTVRYGDKSYDGRTLYAFSPNRADAERTFAGMNYKFLTEHPGAKVIRTQTAHTSTFDTIKYEPIGK